MHYGYSPYKPWSLFGDAEKIEIAIKLHLRIGKKHKATHVGEGDERVSVCVYFIRQLQIFFFKTT